VSQQVFPLIPTTAQETLVAWTGEVMKNVNSFRGAPMTLENGRTLNVGGKRSQVWWMMTPVFVGGIPYLHLVS
jgi:hypothetical protein